MKTTNEIFIKILPEM